MKNKTITQKELKEKLKYYSETGVFRWLVSPGRGVKAGDVAGNIHKINGYRLIGINGNVYRASRLAYLYMEGYFPEYDVDHIDRNRSNDAWKNLRHVSRACNMRNQALRSDNKSGIMGVYWNKRAQKWHAGIRILGKQKHLGVFSTLIDAARARWQAEKKYNWNICNAATSSAFEFLKEQQQ